MPEYWLHEVTIWLRCWLVFISLQLRCQDCSLLYIGDNKIVSINWNLPFLVYGHTCLDVFFHGTQITHSQPIRLWKKDCLGLVSGLSGSRGSYQAVFAGNWGLRDGFFCIFLGQTKPRQFFYRRNFQLPLWKEALQEWVDKLWLQENKYHMLAYISNFNWVPWFQEQCSPLSHIYHKCTLDHCGQPAQNLQWPIFGLTLSKSHFLVLCLDAWYALNRGKQVLITDL